MERIYIKQLNCKIVWVSTIIMFLSTPGKITCFFSLFIFPFHEHVTKGRDGHSKKSPDNCKSSCDILSILLVQIFQFSPLQRSYWTWKLDLSLSSGGNRKHHSIFILFTVLLYCRSWPQSVRNFLLTGSCWYIFQLQVNHVFYLKIVCSMEYMEFV